MICRADARHIPLADGSVHCCVTSPPYWGLRDYGLASWEGMDAGCDHRVDSNHKAFATSGLEGSKINVHNALAGHETCPKCGAVRRDSGIGLEKTPEEYVANIVQVFREVKRVLHPSGTAFINLGDCYSSREYGIIRQDVNPEEIPLDVWTYLLGVWQGSRGASLQGNVLDLLSSRLEQVSSAGPERPREELLPETPQGLPDEDGRQEQSPSNQDAGRLGREVRLLRREKQDFPVPGPHQRRGAKGTQPKGWRTGGLEEGNQRRSTEGPLPGSMLELQRSPWALRLLSTLEVDLSDIPREARRFFTVTLKPKDLVGIPWRVAFALQADGWYLRSDIIWHKPNPMPESVTDRPTKAHEHLFLLSKRPRYYYDAEAIREQGTTTRPELLAFGEERPDVGFPGHSNGRRRSKKPDGWDTEPSEIRFGRNRRDVWTIPTSPYKGAHFATFPPKLVEPCVLAGSPAGGIVLDPFCGSGTVGQVCRENGRRFVGLDLSWKYLHELAYARAELGQLALA